MDHQLKNQYEEVYSTYVQPLFRHCFFRLYDREIAKEITQETFMKTWDYLAEGNHIDNMRAFLYKVANNLIINEIKRRKPEASIEEMSESVNFDPIDENSLTPEQVAISREVIDKIKLLEPNYRQAIFMRFVDGLSVKEIASLLNETESNISVRIHRGIEKLREIYS